MKKSIRSLIALLLAVLMMSSLAVIAYAEDPTYIYTDGQYYEADESLIYVYTVQVSAGPNQSGAERTRAEMLAAGFDCFLYSVDDGFRIMCGKFQDVGNAYRYCELIKKKTERDKAYVTGAYLPESALEDFVANYKQDPKVANVYFNGWETPTGPFVDMNANEEETANLYTVQYSGGSNFQAAEKRRDELIQMGFDGYVVKLSGCYIIVAGVFENREDARAYRTQIQEASNRWDSSVRQLQLPVSLLK